jgi:hypothetical protein
MLVGTVRQGQRHYIETRVIKPALRILLEEGTELIAGADHRALTARGWKFVMGTGALAPGPVRDLDYRRGHLKRPGRRRGNPAVAGARAARARYAAS